MTEQEKRQDQETGRPTDLDEGQLEQSSGGSLPPNELKEPVPLRYDPVNLRG